MSKAIEVVWRFGFCVLAILRLSCVAQMSPPSYIAKTHELEFDLPAGVTTSKCAVVTSEGHLYLEVKKQRPPNFTLTFSAYEQSLAPSEVLELRSIISESSVPDLPRLEQPLSPFPMTYFRGFSAITSPQGQEHLVGYFAWRTEDDKLAGPKFATTEMQQRWKKSEEVLTPLVTWFHQLESMDLAPSKVKRGLCSTEKEPKLLNPLPTSSEMRTK